MRRFLIVLLLGGVACGQLLGTSDEDPPVTTAGAGADAGTDAASTEGSGEAGPFEAGVDAPEPPPVTKIVFVTTASASGTLSFSGQAGAAGATEECKREAGDAGLGTNFAAWLSTGTTDAISLLPDNVGWRIRGGPVVFPSKAAIEAGALVPIDRDANGNEIVGPKNSVWTGTTSNGTKANDRCADWKAVTSYTYGMVGAFGATGPAWTGTATSSCSSPFRVFCFEL